MTTPVRLWSRPSFVLPAAASALLLLFVTLYVIDRPAYFVILRGWGFGPFAFPFLDADYTTAQIRCWQRGIDVYRINPCDILGRLHDYSPVWLRLRFLGLDRGWTNFVGLTQAALYIASLAVLPAAPSSRARLVMMAAIASPLSLFAVERGNVDLLMFAAACLFALLLERGVLARLSGYGLVLAAASLKFYPLVLLAAVLRETSRVAAAVIGIAAAATAIFVLAFGAETLRALHNVPHPLPFGDGMGAAQWGDAVAILFGATWVARPMTMALLMTASCGAVALASRPGFCRGLSLLAPRDSNCLLIGTLLMAGCFFTGPSVGYRGIFLIIALPGLLALSEQPQAGLIARLCPLAALLALWLNLALAIANGSVLVTGAPGSPLFDALCLLREAIWWGLMTVFLAVPVRFAIGSLEVPARRALARRTR